MALAIKLQDMIDRGEIADYAEIARLGFVTRARVTQIMNLLLLAPDIQEELLSQAVESTGESRVFERALREVGRFADWREQKKLWVASGWSARGVTAVSKGSIRSDADLLSGRQRLGASSATRPDRGGEAAHCGPEEN